MRLFDGVARQGLCRHEVWHHMQLSEVEPPHHLHTAETKSGRCSAGCPVAPTKKQAGRSTSSTFYSNS